MSLGVCILATWITIIILCIVPKRLSEKDMVLVYFFDTIFVVISFTILNLNMQFLTESQDAADEIGVLICNNILIPLSLLIFSNISMYQSKIIKYSSTVAICIGLSLFQKLLERMGAIHFNHWNILNAFLLMCLFLIFSRIATFIVNFSFKRVGEM